MFSDNLSGYEHARMPLILKSTKDNLTIHTFNYLEVSFV